MITVPSHVKNSKIGEDIRKTNGNPVVILRDEAHPLFKMVERAIFSRTSFASFLIVALILYTSRAPFLKAASTSFYPKACLGGFSGVKNAEGKPETKADEGADFFDEENSAILTGDQSSEIYCGNFDGEVVDNTVPKDVILTIHLAVKERKQTALIKAGGTESSSTFLQVMDATTTPSIEGGGGEGKEMVRKDATSSASATPLESKKGDTGVSPTTPVIVPVDTVTPVVDSPQVFLHKVESLALSHFVSAAYAEDAPDITTSPLDTPPSPPQEIVKEGDTPSINSPIIGKTTSASDSSLIPSTSSSTPPSGGIRIQDFSVESSSSTETATASSSPTLFTEMSASSTEKVVEKLAGLFDGKEVSLNTQASTTHPIYEIAFTFGGDEWTPLALLGNDNASSISLVIPKESITSWKDISALQVKIKNIENLDQRKDLYVDGMSLSIHYDKDKEGVREYIIKDIQNESEAMTVSVGGEKGKNKTVLVKSSEKSGLAVYNIEDGSLLFTTETNIDNPIEMDPNNILPNYGSYALVLTRDESWCSSKKLKDCVESSTFKAVSYINLFSSQEVKEGKSITEVKKEFALRLNQSASTTTQKVASSSTATQSAVVEKDKEILPINTKSKEVIDEEKKISSVKEIETTKSIMPKKESQPKEEVVLDVAGPIKKTTETSGVEGTLETKEQKVQE